MSISSDEKETIEALWQGYKQTEEIASRDALIVHYLHLVKYVVGRVGASLPSYVKLDDLYSSGVTGLVRAVERFDLTKNSKFESYALLLIKGAIIDELRALDWVPRSVHQKAHTVAHAQEKLQQTLGRDPTDLELAHNLGLSEPELIDLLDRVRPAVLISLYTEAYTQNGEEGEGYLLLDKIADTKAVCGAEVAEKREYAQIMERAIQDLPEQERRVLILYYYEELMLKEIGQVMGVSESRVSQIHTKALLKLRSKLARTVGRP